MILVDTSVWIDHHRGTAPHLTDLLNQNLVATHPGIIGELACGFLADRQAFLHLLRGLPQVSEASHDEALFFIEVHRVFGKGAGYIDIHLMTAAVINGVRFWTRDKRLVQIASHLNIAYSALP